MKSSRAGSPSSTSSSSCSNANRGSSAAADGSTYTAELPGHERISGEVWHRGRNQIGLTVSEWDDALMVVVNRPKSESAPHGGGSILISTFGLDDAVFKALEAKWRAW